MRKSLMFWAIASLGAAVLTSPFALSSAQAADKVGVAAAVKPEATSQPPGGETTTLKIGKAVLYNERIDTSGSGVVQVLLLDGSTFTVGPGSSLVIDKFVYNPGTGKGSLVASFSKGALRYVIKVNGPNRLAAACVFGDFLALKRNGVLDMVRPDNMFVVSGPGPALKRATTPADINSLLAAVSGQKTKLAGKTVKGKSWPYYYGIQPTGYPDQPFIRELYYDTAAGDIARSNLRAVPMPRPEPPFIPPQLPPVIDGPCTSNLC